MKRSLFLIVLAAILVGCSEGGGELSNKYNYDDNVNLFLLEDAKFWGAPGITSSNIVEWTEARSNVYIYPYIIILNFYDEAFRNREAEIRPIGKYMTQQAHAYVEEISGQPWDNTWWKYGFFLYFYCTITDVSITTNKQLFAHQADGELSDMFNIRIPHFIFDYEGNLVDKADPLDSSNVYTIDEVIEGRFMFTEDMYFLTKEGVELIDECPGEVEFTIAITLSNGLHLQDKFVVEYR